MKYLFHPSWFRTASHFSFLEYGQLSSVIISRNFYSKGMHRSLFYEPSRPFNLHGTNQVGIGGSEKRSQLKGSSSHTVLKQIDTRRLYQNN